jgi:hypothetical protein
MSDEHMQGMGAISGSHPTGQDLKGLGASRFDPERIRDLPERLFAHSLALIGDDEEEEPSTLFLEVQEAAGMLASIRNAAGLKP